MGVWDSIKGAPVIGSVVSGVGNIWDAATGQGGSPTQYWDSQAATQQAMGNTQNIYNLAMMRAMGINPATAMGGGGGGGGPGEVKQPATNQPGQSGGPWVPGSSTPMSAGDLANLQQSARQSDSDKARLQGLRDANHDSTAGAQSGQDTTSAQAGAAQHSAWRDYADQEQKTDKLKQGADYTHRTADQQSNTDQQGGGSIGTVTGPTMARSMSATGRSPTPIPPGQSADSGVAGGAASGGGSSPYAPGSGGGGGGGFSPYAPTGGGQPGGLPVAGGTSGATAGTMGPGTGAQQDDGGAFGSAPRVDLATAQQVGVDTVNAQTIGTPDIIGGQQASDLRAQQLAQAGAAANSPSAAAAQMKAAGQQIAHQQMGVAATARGADRASAKRDAMLGIGTQGMQASQQASALAATEQAQKQQAFAANLAGIRAGDVNSSQALTQIGAANQAANLQAQQYTQNLSLQAQQANQQAGLAATGMNNTARANAYQVGNAASLGYLNAATQAQGAQNQAQATAAGYGASLTGATMQQQGGIIGAIGGAVGRLSDERTKEDAAHIGDEGDWGDAYSALNKSIYHGSSGGVNPYAMAGEDVAPRFLAPKAPKNAFDTLAFTQPEAGTNEDGKPVMMMTENTTGAVQPAAADQGFGYASPYGSGNWADAYAQDPNAANLSDERAKRQVEHMSDRDVIDWASLVKPITYRYKEGFKDGGAQPHVGVSAQELERTGPMGRLMVQKGQDGLRRVDYGALGVMLGIAAKKEAERHGV